MLAGGLWRRSYQHPSRRKITLCGAFVWMGIEVTKAIHAHGVIARAKHYVVNDQEYERFHDVTCEANPSRKSVASARRLGSNSQGNQEQPAENDDVLKEVYEPGPGHAFRLGHGTG